MTQNQISHWRNVLSAKELEDRKRQTDETIRHNKDTENMNRNLAVYQALKYQREAEKAQTDRKSGLITALSKLWGAATGTLKG